MKSIYEINGEVIFYDPGPEMMEYFKQIDPSYRVESLRPGKDFIPKFQLLKETKFSADGLLFDMSLSELISMLESSKINSEGAQETYAYSGLDLLNILALKSLRECKLCGWTCLTDRYQEKGRCGLDTKIFTSKPFIHIAEEGVINPAIVTNFAACALRCRYCVEYKNWDVKNLSPASPKKLWNQIANFFDQGIPVNSLEFTNPTESFAGVVGILAEAPSSFRLPVILNCHLYGSNFFYKLGNYITDVWLVDLRYGNDRCAKALSGVGNYLRHAKDGLNAMVANGAKIIVRILVLPGHGSCCHLPAMELLSAYRDNVWVSILDQYIPEHEAHLDPNLKRRPTSEEITAVEALVDKYGLRNIAIRCDEFWDS